MPKPQKLTELIGSIYDTALDVAAWTDALPRINMFVGGEACGVFSKDAISKLGSTHYYWGADPHYIQLYADTHSKFDPLAVLPRLGQVATIPDLVAYEEYRRGRFYREWLLPQGSADAANVVLQQASSEPAILFTVLPGNRRMVSDDMRRRIGFVVPHLQRALHISTAIGLKQTESVTLAASLDGLSTAVFLVDAAGQIMHMNAAASHLLKMRKFLRCVNGRIIASDIGINQSLSKAFARFGSGGVENESIALALNQCDGERYVAHVMALASGVVRRAIGTANKAVAAVFVRKASLQVPCAVELIAKIYKLTRSEVRVLVAIIDVGGVPETADALGIGETTVRTHLYRIFSKTGVSRQADLIRLAAEFSNPLMSSATTSR
jgi:DNA-binding CsgD family transcriptional regulator/PAS domain-containing protein